MVVLMAAVFVSIVGVVASLLWTFPVHRVRVTSSHGASCWEWSSRALWLGARRFGSLWT